MKKCIQCQKDLDGKQKKYCNKKCKDKYYYDNNSLHRERKIERAKERVIEKRELAKLKGKKKVYLDMIEQLTKEESEEDKMLRLLYEKIYKK